MFLFFFFQAEDGIRDADVTGVQTCALPICARARPGGHRHRPPPPRRRAAARVRGARPAAAGLPLAGEGPVRRRRRVQAGAGADARPGPLVQSAAPLPRLRRARHGRGRRPAHRGEPDPGAARPQAALRLALAGARRPRGRDGAAAIARALETLNARRQAMDQRTLDEAVALADATLRPDDRALVLAADGW